MSDPRATRTAPPAAHLHPVFDQLRSGLAVLAGDGTWLQANPAIGRLLGVDPEALAGAPAHRTALGPVADEIDAALARLADGGEGLQQAPVVLGDAGTGERHLQLDLHALPHDPATGEVRRLLQLHDVTALRALEQQQDTLAFGISHELRAPVRAIEQFSRRLRAQEGSDPSTHAHLQRISDAASNAGGLIDALLEYMRASKPPRPARAVDVSLLGDWICVELQDADPTRATDITIAPDLWAHGDEHALKQLLGKLLRNAWTFSSDRPTVVIAVDGEVVDGRLRLAVRDAGRGFDMRYAPKLFAPFRRLHSADDGAGHGLGLVIAQRLAHAQGGRIWVQSEPEVGSTFFIDLPAVPDEDATQA
ncbi:MULTISPECIES: PAS domain-containing sensor histidine kinase [Luteimonas]|uniref:PAS domain-containing sensor histidine kinase n=1 Tax=Luteimonas TaxID=83614 RepID=UPI0013046917|nr:MULTISPECIES: PAS domain-containing sensor histidine kinase [Luteimonas]